MDRSKGFQAYQSGYLPGAPAMVPQPIQVRDVRRRQDFESDSQIVKKSHVGSAE
jgi:hypothetical protein